MKDNYSDKVGSGAEFFLEGISDQSKLDLLKKKSLRKASNKSYSRRFLQTLHYRRND